MKKRAAASTRKKSRRRLSTLAVANVILMAGASKAAETPAKADGSPAPAPQASATPSSSATSAAKPHAPETPQITVTGQTIQSYNADGVALPKFTGPLRDTPQSVTVVPRELMNDENNTTLRDVLRNVSGISIAAGEGGSQGDNLTLRGFTARNDIFLDGMRDYGSYYRDPFNFQDVDVLEGPASVLFGRGSTGGIINQESKTPELEPFVTGTLSFGTDSTRRGTLDVNEPVPGLGTGSVIRLNLMGHDSEVAERNVGENSRYGIAPSISLGLGTATEVTLNYLHVSEDDIPDYGIPFHFNEPADVPRENYYGFVDDFLKTDADIITAKVVHRVNESLSFRDQARYATYERDFRITEPRIDGATTPATPPAAIIVNRNELGGRSTETYLWNQFDVTARFQTGFIAHTLVTGLEGGRETSDPTRFSYVGVPPTSYLSPDEDARFSDTSSSVRSKVETTATSFGFYALDTLKLGDHLQLSGGGRWDYFDADYHAAAVGTTPAASFDQTVTKPSWRAAVVYKPSEIGSIYFDYGTSFNPSAESLSLSAANANTPPEESETFEFGTKWDLLQERLSVRASIFRTEKTNAREPDPNDPTLNVLGGEQRVDGIELAASGHLTDRWQIFGSYDYLNSEAVDSKAYPGAIGYPLANVPKNTFSFWTTYDLPWHLQVGGGVNYVGSRTASSTAPLDPTTGLLKEVPGYWTLSAMAKYSVNKHIDLQVNIYNLTNNYFYDQIHPGHIIPGAGLSALFSTSFRF